MAHLGLQCHDIGIKKMPGHFLVQCTTHRRQHPMVPKLPDFGASRATPARRRCCIPRETSRVVATAVATAQAREGGSRLQPRDEVQRKRGFGPTRSSMHSPGPHNAPRRGIQPPCHARPRLEVRRGRGMEHDGKKEFMQPMIYTSDSDFRFRSHVRLSRRLKGLPNSVISARAYFTI